MPKIDAYEEEILKAYEERKLKSFATKEELGKFKAAARATAIKERRVSIRPALRSKPEPSSTSKRHSRSADLRGHGETE